MAVIQTPEPAALEPLAPPRALLTETNPRINNLKSCPNSPQSGCSFCRRWKPLPEHCRDSQQPWDPKDAKKELKLENFGTLINKVTHEQRGEGLTSWGQLKKLI